MEILRVASFVTFFPDFRNLATTVMCLKPIIFFPEAEI